MHRTGAAADAAAVVQSKTVPAESAHASALDTLHALTSLALVCMSSPTNLFRLGAASANGPEGALLELAAARAADTFRFTDLRMATDVVFPTHGMPYGTSIYRAFATLPALYNEYGCVLCHMHAWHSRTGATDTCMTCVRVQAREDRGLFGAARGGQRRRA
jgi:hypothetical protein